MAAVISAEAVLGGSMATVTAIRETMAAPAAMRVTAAAAATAAGAAMEAGRAIEVFARGSRILIYRNPHSLDSFQNEGCITLESLQNAVFSFASREPLTIWKGIASPSDPSN
jgi:hypothetical protein